ncbi:hypothetical protein ACQ4LE_004446 [Meloidogyne hapla]
MEEANLPIKREREDEDGREGTRDDGDAPVVVAGESNLSTSTVLQNKLDMLRQEESALLSLLSRLRSQQRTLQLEQNKLNDIYENKIRERENNE